MLKKLKITDYIIILMIVVFCITAGLVIFKKKNFSNLPIEKEAKIRFEVFFRGITITADKMPFMIGDNAFITIRNVPYTKLKIVGLNGRPRLAYVPAKNAKGYEILEDISTPNLFDLVIQLEDTAKKTADGYVAGGNKIKMGIPIVIEGERYKYSGTISNITEVEEEQNPQ